MATGQPRYGWHHPQSPWAMSSSLVQLHEHMRKLVFLWVRPTPDEGCSEFSGTRELVCAKNQQQGSGEG